MESYHLKTPVRTKFFNFFRRIFFFRPFENFLVRKTTVNSNSFFSKLVPPDYMYPKETFRSATRNGINYKLDLSNVVDHYIYFGKVDADYKSVLQDIKNASTILDIGGNIGTTSLFFASKNPDAKIYTFEPHPVIFKRAEENIKLNSFQNITLINKGLGIEKASFKLYEVNEHNPGMNRILDEGTDLPFVVIDVDSLDNILASYGVTNVDFIKIDVEGFESNVIKGSTETLKNKPKLFIEVNDDNLKENASSAKALVNILEDAGYNHFCDAEDLKTITNASNFDHCHFDLIAWSE